VIEKDIYGYLSSDAELAALLGAKGSDRHIYPVYAKTGSPLPRIVYSVEGAGGRGAEHVQETVMTFQTTAETYGRASEVADKLYRLLNNAEPGSIPCSGGRIYYSRLIGGEDFSDELRRPVKALSFVFKYRKYGD